MNEPPVTISEPHQKCQWNSS